MSTVAAGRVAVGDNAVMSDLAPTTLRCRIVGHRWEFVAEGNDVVWFCGRGCGEAGRRTYEDAKEARRFAAAFARGGPGSSAGAFATFSGAGRDPRREKR